MIRVLLFSLILVFTFRTGPEFLLPVATHDRHVINGLEITGIGAFGLKRKARPGIPAHYHTGIDIRRPENNYTDEPVFPIAPGIVISKRTDGPFAQLIIEHDQGQKKYWTVYEHIAGIKVKVMQYVNPDQPIARFMNREELDRYGWQFDHFHFEVLKVPPLRLKPGNKNPDRHFTPYTLVCYTPEDLDRYYYDPVNFLESHL